MGSLLTSKNSAHQDPRQDPGQGEVGPRRSAPVLRLLRGVGVDWCFRAARGTGPGWLGPCQDGGQTSAISKETTVPPKRLGPVCQESATESTSCSPRPCASSAAGRLSRTLSGSP